MFLSCSWCPSLGTPGGVPFGGVRVLSLRSSVTHGFVTEPWYDHHVRVFMWARGLECARVARSLVCVPCFMLEHGVWIPALMSWVLVTWRGSDTRAPFSVIVWVRGLEFARHRALLSTCILLCCTQFVFLSAACFHVVMSCVNTWLMSFLISCVFMYCFAHGWWFVCWPCACVSVLCEYVASVLVFCVPCALMSICLDPTHLVTCLLINFPQLLSLITLIICSLCGFVTIYWVVYVLCPVLPCPVQPVCFSPTG